LIELPRPSARSRTAISAALVATLLACGCSKEVSRTKVIKLATTTSVQDSGLLEVLLPRFREQTEIEVQVIAVGSGQAIELGRRGDADVLITHSPAAEQKFVDDGFCKDRRPVMYNDFVLLGPANDPVGVTATTSIESAFKKLTEASQPFLSRGDDSGTHIKELAIWKQAGIVPEGKWYLKGGVGMAQALRMSSEKQAYTLSDRGTYLALKHELDLAILSEGDDILRNDYSVMVVSGGKEPSENTTEATRFADFLTASETQQTIAQFGVEKFGEPLFHPAE
jgi:tungstate transport system substrate-binding protein